MTEIIKRRSFRDEAGPWLYWLIGLGLWFSVTLMGSNLGAGGYIAIAGAIVQSFLSLMIALKRHPLARSPRTSAAGRLAALWISYLSGNFIWMLVATNGRPLSSALLLGMGAAAMLLLIANVFALKQVLETEEE